LCFNTHGGEDQSGETMRRAGRFFCDGAGNKGGETGRRAEIIFAMGRKIRAEKQNGERADFSQWGGK